MGHIILVLTPSVLLRQNPHNVHEWLKRVKLFEGKPREVSHWLIGVSCLKSYAPLYGNSYNHSAHPHTLALTLTTPLSQIINTYTEAVQTVDIDQAVGKPNTLWVNFAKFYEENDQLPEVWRL